MVNDKLSCFMKDKNNMYIYIYGCTGIGKTNYIESIMKKNNSEYKLVSLFNIKTEENLEKISNSRNVMNMFYTNGSKYRYIIIDDIDHLSNIDKKILTIIYNKIKVTVSKRSSKMKKKIIPFHKDLKVIFIGTNTTDKKVRDIMSVCLNYNIEQKLKSLFSKSIYMQDINKNIISILNCDYNSDQVLVGDKSSMVMVLHENIIRNIERIIKLDDINKVIEFYSKFINNIATSDIYDRISFQKQLWRLTELSHHIKIDLNYELYTKFCKETKCNFKKSLLENEIIFTKILTKYSNEYTNLNYINDICNDNCIPKYMLFNYVYEDNDELSDSEKERLKKIFNLS